MSLKESDMKGRREERNVLDELLDHHEDDELDVELNKGFKKSRAFLRQGMKVMKLPTAQVEHLGARYKDKSNGNGKRVPRAESPCSVSSSHSSRSCSCSRHGSVASRSASVDSAASRGSYQSFTRSPSLKIKIHTNTNSRTVKNLKAPSPPPNLEITHKRKRHEEDNDVRQKRKKRSSSKRRDYESLLKYFFKDSCYFVMKSNNEENILISKREGVWATPRVNEIKLNSAFKEFRNVILIFSVKESGKFQGFARLSSAANYDCEPVNWVLPPGIDSCPFGGLFFVDWICLKDLSFLSTSHLYNEFNEGKPVKIGRDGQEIDPQVGEELCRLFPSDNTVDLIPLLKRMKKQTQNRPKKRHTRGPFMEFDRATSSSQSEHRARSPPSGKRFGSNGRNMPRLHSTSRDDRTYGNFDRPRMPSRREDIPNGTYRSHSNNSYDQHDSYRRMAPRNSSNTYGSRHDRRPRDERRY